MWRVSHEDPGVWEMIHGAFGYLSLPCFSAHSIYSIGQFWHLYFCNYDSRGLSSLFS